MSKKAKAKSSKAKPASVTYEEPLLEPEPEPEPAEPDALSIIAESPGHGAAGKVGLATAQGILTNLKNAGLL